MVKKCIYENCNKIPTFNLPTETRGLYCFEHKKENMINVKHKRCIHPNCNKQPSFNLPTETRGLYCFEHKKENMICVTVKRCIHPNCNTRPSFNLPTETRGLYCFEHKKENMINVNSKLCQHNKCKNDAIYGFINKRPQYCHKHKQKDMINLYLHNKCNVLDCENEYEFVIDNIKYCYQHHPNSAVETILKRKCRWCDLEETTYVCNDCKKVQNKKEWSIVRYLRKQIDTQFEYNSSKMLDGCSKKRPDIYFELNKHCVIVEIDEHQHNTYGDICECARLNEIVNGIGGKSVIVIRYNPDKIKNNNKTIKIDQLTRLNLLVNTIKKELMKDYNTFVVKIIQLYYNDDYDEYKEIKKENITKVVCV